MRHGGSFTQIDPVVMRHRHALYEESEKQMQEARAYASAGMLRRKISDTKQWLQAMVLLKQVRDSFGSMEHRLRSTELKPNFVLDKFGANAAWPEAVAEVIAKRSRLVGKVEVGKDEVEKDVEKTGGRMLLYFPDENFACGAAEYSSSGFFDVNNVPPWDIWVHFSERTLVSWVPPALVDIAQMGIDVNPEGCICWTD